MADEAQKRETAVYNDTRNRLRHTREDLSDEAIDKIALAAVEAAVFGHDHKVDRNGVPIQQGVGSPGRETVNHFAAIRKYEGQAAWEKAVRELWKRDAKHAERLNLPRPAAT